EGRFRWKTIGRDLRKYVGHRVQIEIVDRGEGFVAVDWVGYEKPRGSDLVQVEEGERAELSPFFEEAKSLRQGLGGSNWVLAMRDGEAENDFVHVRGGARSFGEEVPRRGLTALGGTRVGGEGSGRLEWAQSLVRPDHPLTSRVWVNRLWHHLFGRGIVATVDDFGVMGEKPTHPELLDWLARDLVRKDWSTKAMLRELVLSRTYRMSCVGENEAEMVAREDEGNVYLHKFRVRRLGAEAIRDGILAVSGRLNREMGGVSVPVHLTSFMEGRGKPKSGPLDGDGRRSVYLATKRNFLSPFQLAFDYPIPFSTMGRRNQSNVPAQSLALMNDPFVIGEAKRWGKRLLKLGSTEERIERAYLEAFSREPSEEEREALGEFLREQQELRRCEVDDAGLWADFCHVVMNAKEFIYLN
ncbi:MAG: DUF1553 domain-containing protein, partial [Verrucomicrobiota bacterium]